MSLFRFFFVFVISLYKLRDVNGRIKIPYFISILFVLFFTSLFFNVYFLNRFVSLHTVLTAECPSIFEQVEEISEDLDELKESRQQKNKS